MSKVKSLAASALIVPMLFTGVAAAAAGQIEGGDIYRVRNVTKNSDFTDPANADQCEAVQFKVRIHNPGPDELTGVRVKATLNAESSESHSSTVTVTADNANPKETTDTAGVKLSKAVAMVYVAGTTELLDANNSKISTLGDGILGAGVEVPEGVGVSTQQKRFVQFQAKIDCPTPPSTPNTPAASNSVSSKPSSLPNTGAGEVAAVAASAAILGAAAYRSRLARNLSK